MIEHDLTAGELESILGIMESLRFVLDTVLEKGPATVS